MKRTSNLNSVFVVTHAALYQFTGTGIIKENFALYTPVGQNELKRKDRYKLINETKINIVAKEGLIEQEI